MLSNDATIQNIKHEILYEVAKLAYAGRFEEEKDEPAWQKANVQQKVTIRVPIT